MSYRSLHPCVALGIAFQAQQYSATLEAVRMAQWPQRDHRVGRWADG